MHFMSNIPQLLCLLALIYLTLPRKAAIVVSVLALLLFTSLGMDKLILLFLLGLTIYKGMSVYRKQSSMPDIKTMAAPLVLTVVLSMAPFIHMRVTSALLLSILAVLLAPKIVSFLRAHPMGLELPELMNKRMLCSLLIFAVTFHMIDDASQGFPQADDGSSVVLMWLLSVSGMLAYGLALHRIPALIVSAIFYLIAFVYLSELRAMGPILSGLRRFSDVLDLFSPWALMVFAVNLIGLVGILVYTWGYKSNPTPPAWIAERVSNFGSEVRKKATAGVKNAKTFAESNHFNEKLEQASAQVKSHLTEVDYQSKFTSQIGWIKSKHQQNPTGFKLTVLIAGALLVWLLI